MENEIKSKITISTQEAAESLNKIKEKINDFAKNTGKAEEEVAGLKETIKSIEGDAVSLERLVDISSNIKSGFTAAKSAAEFFGFETKKVASIIDKVSKAQKTFSSIQKIFNKIQGKSTSIITKSASAKNKLAGSIGGATKSFKLFNKAMSGSIIGAIITAVATLAAYWGDIREALRFTSNEQKDLLATSEANLAAEEGKLNSLESQENVLRLSGKSEKEILDSKLRQTNATITSAKANIEQQKSMLASQLEAEKKNKKILKDVLGFVSVGFLGLLKVVDLIASAFNKKLGLSEGFNELLASQFFNPEEVEKKGNEAIKVAEDKLAELESQAAGYALSIGSINKDAAKKYWSSFKKQIEEELKILKQKNSLTEKIELNALEKLNKYKLISENEYRLKRLKIIEKYDIIEKKKREKKIDEIKDNAQKLVDTEKEGLINVLKQQNNIYDAKLNNERLKLAQGKTTQEQFATESLRIETERLQKLKEVQDQYHNQSNINVQKYFNDKVSALELDRENNKISDADYNSQLASLKEEEINAKREIKITRTQEEAALEATIFENKLAAEAAATQISKEAEEKAAADRKARAEVELAFKKKLQEDTLKLASVLGDLLQKEGQKQNKIQKGVALVKIGIDTAKAISSALSTANAPTADNVITGGLAGIAKFVIISAQVLSAAAQAKRVLSSGGQGSAGSSTPATPAAASAPTVSAPRITAPRIAGTPIIARQNNPQPIKVFVSEADIRNTQRKVQVIEEQSEVV